MKQQLLTPLKIPEATVKNLSIRHKHYRAGDEFAIVSIRTALMTGRRQSRGIMSHSGHFHQLVDQNGIWMTDIPQEQEQIDRMLPKIKGRVLVGGLGLGLAVVKFAMLPTVDSIVVVEKDRAVYDLVWNHLPGIVHQKSVCVVQDLYDYLDEAKARKIKHNTAYIDIYRSDGERTLFEHVFPLRILARGVIPNRSIHFWNEDVMDGQIQIGLQGHLISDYPKWLHKPVEEVMDIFEKQGKWGIFQKLFWKHVLVEQLNMDAARKYIPLYVKRLKTLQFITDNFNGKG